MKTVVRALALVACLVSGLSLLAANDAYVESTEATQYVNTGYCIGPNTRVELDFQLTSDTQQQARLFGSADPAQRMDCYIGGAKDAEGRTTDCFSFLQRRPDQTTNDAKNLPDARADLGRHIAIFDKSTRYIGVLTDGAVTAEAYLATSTNAVSRYPLAVFGNNYNERGDSFASFTLMKVYGLRIYESGSLVRDFIPALKDGRAGLYDTLTKRFICDTRATAKNLAYGGDILDLGEDGYIASTGVQGINLRHKNVAGTRLELDFALVEVQGGLRRLYGNSGGNASWSFNCFVDDSYKVNFSHGDTWTTQNTGVIADTNRHTVIQTTLADKARFSYVTGCTTNYTTSVDSVNTAARPWPILLFGNAAAADGFRSSNASKLKVYGCRIWVGEELVHDYVPCLKGCVAGLKDLVDGAFVTCEADVDPLLSGGNIAAEPEDGYIRSTGTQYIDTGYKVNDKTRVELDFVLEENKVQWYFFGNHLASVTAGSLAFMGWQDPNGAFGWVARKESNNFRRTTVTNNLSRRTYVLDAANKKVVILTAGYTNYTTSVSDDIAGAKQAQTMPIFGVYDMNGKIVPDKMAKMRLYGCRIFEDGVIKRDYVPFVKGGFVGLSNTVDGVFVPCALGCDNFIAGGAILGDAGRFDAYIEADGTQAISTGYKANPNKTRVEVDFAYNKVHGGDRIFSNNGDLYLDMYINGSADNAGSYSLITGDKTVSGKTDNDNTGSLMSADASRHLAVVDLKNRKFSLSGKAGTVSGKLPYAKAAATYTYTANNPLGLFAKNGNATGTSFSSLSKAKIYSVRIYEDEELVHEYLPYGTGSHVGFRDTQTGTKLYNTKTSTELTIGGGGYDGSGTANPFVQLPGPQKVASGDEKELFVFAPGAVSYRWTRDGAELPDETGETLTHVWTRRPRQTVYTVTAVFNVDGATVESAPQTITVENEPLGTAIIIR